MKRITCKDYYDYVIRQLERVGGGNISIYGKMPKRCIGYFERRGIKVTKELFGYIKFEEKNEKKNNSRMG